MKVTKSFLAIQIGGAFVKDFQYSQGHFDFNTIMDPSLAEPMTQELFEHMFGGPEFGIRSKYQPSTKDAKLVQITVTTEVTEKSLKI